MMRLVGLLVLSALVFLPGLGRSSRLSYHEAFVAQGAREMLDSGIWAYPTIGGLPWLEKPPLPWWLTVALGRLAGGVDETVARLPSVLAATLLVFGVAVAATRHYGRGIGVLAGAIQATTAWTVLRGRLAEADMLLACLITWAIVAFDRMRDDGPEPCDKTPPGPPFVRGGNGTGAPPASESSLSPPNEGGARGGSAQVRTDAGPATRSGGWRRARWAFFVLLGATSQVKGIGFGAVLILSVVAASAIWRRDGTAMRRLRFPAGWIVATVLAAAWPLAMVAWHGFGALALWTLHVTDRLAAHPGEFAGERWWQYTPGLLIQAMPWTPLVLIGAWHSLRRAVLGRDGRTGAIAGTENAVPAVVAGDRLLWAWSAAPLALLALATVKNAHYAIAAQVPWSIWAALGLVRVGGRLVRRGWTPDRLRRLAVAGFAGLGFVTGSSFWLLGPWFDRRGVEWAFYESAAGHLPPDASLTLLYDDWDRNPYESPFGAFPHDLAVRFFYLGRTACWHSGTDDLASHHFLALEKAGAEGGDGTSPATHIIGRDRDLPALGSLGHVEVLAGGPSVRFDRTYTLFRIMPAPATARDPASPIASAEDSGVQR
jgi:4-amino-4-deoxy-L-arabinose transferase-like glycosyltransferase